MAKEGKHHKLNPVRKYAKIIVNGVFKGFGIAVVARPGIDAVVAWQGNPAMIPNQLLYNYTGFDGNNYANPFDWRKMTIAAAHIIGGIALMKIGSVVASKV